MPLIDTKYDQLFLKDQYLTDPILMALAWKKAHHYIRTTNWYADNFELDKSSLNLAKHCGEWVEEIENHNLKFSPLELVPAPKTSVWEFKNEYLSPRKYSDSFFGPDIETIEKSGLCIDWYPSDYKNLRLRPLAHIGIKEQSVMTLMMMCIANDVETAQGDPSTAYDDVHDKGVVSYGNRLYCQYKDGKAEHSFGATTVFSKFFSDYRTFLNRPYYFAAQEKTEISPDEEVYLVELDLKQFFDLVKRDVLIKKIKDIRDNQAFHASDKQDNVDIVLGIFENWSWSDNTAINYHLCETDEVSAPPSGLPQGLVASGFLANIYMLEFDTALKESIGKAIAETEETEQKVKIIDYCRYVDDMRLVVVGPSRKKLESDTIRFIKSKIEQLAEDLLKDLGLHLNKEKTKVEIYRGKSVGISKTLQDIQSKGSGPMSMEDVEEQLTQLESLLMLSPPSQKVTIEKPYGGDLVLSRHIKELIKLSSQESPETAREIDSEIEEIFAQIKKAITDVNLPKDDNTSDAECKCDPNLLANIEKNIFDIREDTLKRFAANKISKKLSEIRHFTSRETDDNGNPKPGEWDYLQERLARRLIACWSHDPSLVLLLKKGLELFPCTKLLNPILKQIKLIKGSAGSSIDSNTRKQGAVVDYCLSEIFRHSAFVIHRKDPHAFPAHANIEDYFEVLQDYAVELLRDQQKNSSSRPKFNLLLGQARFLLLTRLDTLLEHDSGDADQDLIFKLAKGFRNIEIDDVQPERISTCILIASHLLENIKPLLRSTNALLSQSKIQTNTTTILELIAAQDPALFKSMVLHARPLSAYWVLSGSVKDLAKKLYIGILPSEKPLEKITSATSLYKLISRTDNPFANEAISLKLLLSLLKEKNFNQFKQTKINNPFFDLGNTTVKFNGYSIPPKFKDFEKEIDSDAKFHSGIGPTSEHLEIDNKETRYLQRAALCLRSALSGSSDPTGFGISHSPRTGYRGLKSTQYKRQLGMMTTPESLAGEGVQCSTWLTTLLAKLLRWPGIHVNDQGFEWPIELTIENVNKLVNERLERLKQNYCQLSGMPGLSELIQPDWPKDKKSLIVAMVQSKMPFKGDFMKYGMELNDPEYRTKHRRHIARVAQLVLKQTEAQHLDKPEKGKREQDIDLIILPELAVHQDDIDILKQLSQKTHAIIFAGLGFLKQPNGKDLRNCALWIVPKKHNGNQNEVMRLQGKHNMMADERKGNIQPWRPYQLMLELKHPKFPLAKGFVLTGAVCFDATDINLSADLKDKSNAFLISALNKDTNTFDTMVDALHYHMHQPVVLVNTGEFGGSYAKAPYKEAHKRLIAHAIGNNQVSISTFEMNMFDFRRDGIGKSMRSDDDMKTPPAGIKYV
ncbi:MAG: RNA-directed DNA polymerase [Marinomonas sp.]